MFSFQEKHGHMFLSAFDCCTKMSHQRFEIDKHLFWKHVFAFRCKFCGKNAGFAKLLFSLLHATQSSRPGPFPRLNTPKVTYIYMPQLDQTFLIPLGSVLPKIFRAMEKRHLQFTIGMTIDLCVKWTIHRPMSGLHRKVDRWRAMIPYHSIQFWNNHAFSK